LPAYPSVFANSATVFSFRHPKCLSAILAITVLKHFLETPGMMLNFASVEKFFTHTTFKTSGATDLFLSESLFPREILNGKARSRLAGQYGAQRATGRAIH
jgi:hypothetical protein